MGGLNSSSRAEYLAQSLMRAKPWEALGMSRATWYRKGKPAPPMTDGEAGGPNTA